jgi:uncharacterized protein with HEPN domain
VEGLNQAQFEADERTQQAVLLNLIIIGEAATRLLLRHPRFAGRHPDVPWEQMKGMRNRIAHGYFDINLRLVWAAVRDHLPALASQLPGVRKDAEGFQEST